MTLINRTASSLSEVLAEAKAIRNLWNPGRDAPEEIWFRGQPKRSHSLLPGLYRPSVLDQGFDELAIFHAFVNLGRSYAAQRPSDDWEWYFVAQHHGLPTRLLDWTESLLAATYFAVESYWHSLDKRDLAGEPPERTAMVFDDDSPTVWVVDAGSVNFFSQGKDALFAPKDEIKSYLPRFMEEPAPAGCCKAEKPISLHPPRQTARIIAQQGMFTLHGHDKMPLDVLASEVDTEHSIKLGCIQLDSTRLASFVDELILAGVSRLALFPDLDSVAEHVKWHYRE